MSAPNLFKLAQEYAALDEIMERLDEEGAGVNGEEVALVRAYVEELDGALDNKLGDVAVYLRLQEAAQKAAEERAEKAKAMALTHRRRAERVRAAVLEVLQAAKTKKVETPEATFSVAETAPSVVVADDVDLDALPADCVRVKREPNKTALKERLAAGESIPGVTLSARGVSLRVK